jgi:hypothetical protein
MLLTQLRVSWHIIDSCWVLVTARQVFQELSFMEKVIFLKISKDSRSFFTFVGTHLDFCNIFQCTLHSCSLLVSLPPSLLPESCYLQFCNLLLNIHETDFLLHLSVYSLHPDLLYPSLQPASLCLVASWTLTVVIVCNCPQIKNKCTNCILPCTLFITCKEK